MLKEGDFMALARMRTLDEAYKELKQLDPHTALSKYALRQMALSGTIPTIRCGRKRLINFDGLLAYLNGEHTDGAPTTAPTFGGVRAVK